VIKETNTGFWVDLTGVASKDNAMLNTPNSRDIAKCKRCGSNKVVKFGQLKGVQRWLCKDCRYKFADNKAFPGMKIPAEQIAWALCMYYEGIAFKNICRYLQQTYNSYPSDSTVYGWIERFTKMALEVEGKNTPGVGDTWIAISTSIKIGEEDVWFWDILDAGSRFLLASHASKELTPDDAGITLAAATKKAGKFPKIILTDRIDVYMEYLDSADNTGSKGVLAKKILDTSDTELLENYRSTFKARTIVMKRFKNIESAKNIIQAWPLHYNYFRPHEITTNTTPAYKAGITSPLKIRVR
jgi:putative transposase